MSKLTFFIALLLFSSLASAQAPSGSISGRITVKQQPLPGVTVTLEAPAQESSAQPRKTFSTKTDSDGRYRFSSVPKGQHVVSPRAAAYVVPMGGVLIRAGKDVAIGENEQLEGIDFDLTRGGVVTGKITDHTGRPIIQQRVTLRKLGANNRATSFFTPNFEMHQTDDRGVYRLFGLPVGRYLLSVGEAKNDGSITVGRVGGYLPLTYYPGTPNEAEAKVIEVTEGGELTDVDIKAGKPEKTYEVRGRIVDGTTGTPLVGVQFSFGATTPGANRINSFGNTGERTNHQGEFLLQGMRPGTYGVFLEPDPGSDYYSDPTMIIVGEDDVEGVEVKAQRGASLSGQVVVEGTNDPALLQRVKEVLVSAYPVGQSQAMQAPSFVRPTTNADGTFQISGLRPGKMRLNTQPRPPLQLLRYEREGVELPKEFELAAGEKMTGVRVVMGYGTSTIRGQLNVVGGTLPPDARFLVIGTKLGTNTPVVGPNGNIQVDARGKFLIENLLPGQYELQLLSVGRPGIAPIPGLQAEKQQVTVGVGEATVTFTINLGEKKEGQQ